ncbi:zinc finger, C4 type [Dictyocaulus viviparus]|uniref:Zinc finger, C4 type n=1 Tax=Dictyocaulus viviparus TaxID=29172 RepID=A0A0D8XIN5_DICVI|nr:zinc finger, C4 type [Dictyocaulus viviparus]
MLFGAAVLHMSAKPVSEMSCCSSGTLNNITIDISGHSKIDNNYELASDTPLCRVCERGYDGSQHFGIEVCRACAAFFRRSIESQKKFVCRKGGDSCQLNAPRKIKCQKCRLSRCLTVGLQPKCEFYNLKLLSIYTQSKPDRYIYWYRLFLKCGHLRVF